MSKIWCTGCENYIPVSGPLPNPYQWHLIADVQFESLEGMVDADALYGASTEAYLCGNCGRLWVYWGDDRTPTEYVPQPKPPLRYPRGDR